MIDLTADRFWLLAGVAVLALSPCHDRRRRQWIFAMANAACLGMLAGVGIVVASGLATAALALALRCRQRHARTSVVVLSAATLLFAFHKTRGFGVPAELAGVPLLRWLGAVSFSYVFLRVWSVVKLHDPATGAPSPMALYNYLYPFHMLAAGPIQSWPDHVAAGDTGPPADRSVIALGIERIVRGLFKKYVLAWILAQLVAGGWNYGSPWLKLAEINGHYIWIFLDFSAYSDIAVGLGLLLGRPAPENFRNPLGARNLVEFWERWHITLSQFIRTHAFFPIQVGLLRRFGRRRQVACAALASLAAFTLCGLWHAFSLRYLAWGAFHGAGLAMFLFWRALLQGRWGETGWKRWQNRPLVLAFGRILTFEFVAFSLHLIAGNWSPQW